MPRRHVFPRKALCRNIERLSDADYAPLLRSSSSDVRLRFPGDTSWAIELQGKAELESWLARVAGSRLQVETIDAASCGWPGRRSVVVRGVARFTSQAGDILYENDFVVWTRMAWGLCTDCQIYDDTQKCAELDDYLRRTRSSG